MVVHRRKSHQREVVVDRAAGLCSGLLDVPTVAPGPQPPLELLTGALDPAAGELENEGRAERKRQQILSAVGYALPLMRGAGGHAVEFGAGTGHFGLLLAKVRPDWRVTLVEVKEYTATGARERAASLALPNVSVFQGTVDEYAATHEPFQLAVGLHLCGLLTDATLELATSRGASACIVPCCYGQVFSSEDHARGGSTAAGMHPRSAAFRAALGDEVESFRMVAKAADLAVSGKGGAFDPTAGTFLSASRCMTLVDTDRLRWVVEEAAARGGSGGGTSSVALGKLSPLSCSPKNSVLVVRAGESPPEEEGAPSLRCVEIEPEPPQEVR